MDIEILFSKNPQNIPFHGNQYVAMVTKKSSFWRQKLPYSLHNSMTEA